MERVETDLTILGLAAQEAERLHEELIHNVNLTRKVLVKMYGWAIRRAREQEGKLYGDPAYYRSAASSYVFALKMLRQNLRAEREQRKRCCMEVLLTRGPLEDYEPR